MVRKIKKRKKKEKPKEVPERKKKELARLVELIDSYQTVIVCSILGIPSSQLQLIRRKLKEKAEIRIVKKKMATKALETSKKEKVKDLGKYLQTNSAIVFSNDDPFDLAATLAESRYAVKAKPGQIAQKDIEIEAGPTDLPPGPAISELSAIGLKAGVEEGKITIKESKVVVKVGEKISKAVADVLSKLDIAPFTIGLEPVGVFDSKAQAIYGAIKIDKEATIEQLQQASVEVRQLALTINYPAKEIIAQLLAKAARDAAAIKKLQPQPAEEKKEEEKPEEKKEKAKEEKKEEATPAQPESPSQLSQESGS